MSHKKPVRIDPASVALPAGGLDSHAHLDSKEYNDNRDEVIERAAACGVTQIGNVFLGPEEYRENASMFTGHANVFFLLGIHPCDGLKCTPSCLEEIEEAFSHDPRLKAVGEIGLDYYWDDCPRELQLEAFSRQMQLARKMGKPVAIHCRDAADDCLTLLEAGGFKDYPLLWHCFGGDAAMAKRIIRNGWHISIPGAVTYPKNEALRKAVAEIPDDRLLLETDCPYLPPVPWRGTCNEPAYLVFTARAVAEARGETPEKIWQLCGDNARKFFGLPAYAGE